MRLFTQLSLVLSVLLLALPSAFAADDAATLYKGKCAMCHGADGTGNTPAGKKLNARDFSSPEVAKETDAQLLETMKNGKNKMPAYKDKLKDDELKSLVAYVRELGKKK
jgi:mono/diheme cytochrome c family protein